MSGTNRMSPKMTRAVATLMEWERQPERLSAQGIYLNPTTARALVTRGIAVYVAGKATRLSPEYRAQLDICSRHGLSRTGNGCAGCNAAEAQATDPRNGVTVDLDRLARLMAHRDHGHTLTDAVMDACDEDSLPDTYPPCRMCGRTDVGTNGDDMCDWCVTKLDAQASRRRTIDAMTRPTGRDASADCGLSANGSAPCVLIADHGGEWHMATGYVWFRDVPPADAQVNPHEWIADVIAGLNRPAEPRRFGVSVEWADDDAAVNGAPCLRTGVIGSYGTYLEAKAEVDRMRASGRWDVVTGVMALYATETDV